MSDDLTPGPAVSAGPTDTGQTTPSDAAPAPPGTAPPGQEGPATRSMTWVWILLAGIAVIAIAWLFFGGQDVAVPEVVGLSQEQATVVLTEAGLKIGRVTDEPTLEAEPGTVMAQSPIADEKAPEGSAVDISVSSIPKAEVPDVVGKVQSEATALLAETGLLVGSVGYEESTEFKAGYVIAQNPEAGTEATYGTPVALVTSKGAPASEAPEEEAPAEEPADEAPDEKPEDEAPAEKPEEEAPAEEPEDSRIEVPDVVGLSQNDAESTLKGIGLKSDAKKAASESVPAGDVISQSPKAGTVMASGSTVTITVSKGAPEAPMATVPDLIGKGVLESIGILREASLKFALDFAPAKENYFKVADQDPKAGSEVDPGTTVTIVVGLPDIASILEGLTIPSVEPPVAEVEEPSAPESEVTTP